MTWPKLRHRLGCTLLAIYVPLLVVGAWPFETTPGLGPLSARARLALAPLAVLPGMAVFTGIDTDLAPTRTCMRLSGMDDAGTWHRLYENECPPKSNWKDSRHQLMEHLFIAMNVPDLLRDNDPLPARPTEPVRRFVALGDLACHSPLFGDEPRERVRMKVTQHLRNVRDGSTALALFRCRWDCRPGALAPPVCRHARDARPPRAPEEP